MPPQPRIVAGVELATSARDLVVRFEETAHESNGRRLVTDWTASRYTANVEHWHPAMTETFEVLEGVLVVTVDGAPRTLRPGDSVALPPGTRHRFAADGPVRWRQTNEPVLRHESLFVRDVARAERRGVDGAPGPVEALLLFQVMDGYPTAGPPLPVLRAIRALLDLLHPVRPR